MSLRPIGGIFLRLDSNGNLNIYDPTGTSRALIINGVFSAVNNSASNNQTAGVSTLSGSLVSSGFGKNITPQLSSRIYASFTLSYGSTAANGSGGLAIYRTTGSIPAAGVVPTGTQLVVGGFADPVANQTVNTAIAWFDTGLVPGTTYNFYLAFFSNGGNTATLANLVVALGEI